MTLEYHHDEDGTLYARTWTTPHGERMYQMVAVYVRGDSSPTVWAPPVLAGQLPPAGGFDVSDTGMTEETAKKAAQTTIASMRMMLRSVADGEDKEQAIVGAAMALAHSVASVVKASSHIKGSEAMLAMMGHVRLGSPNRLNLLMESMTQELAMSLCIQCHAESPEEVAQYVASIIPDTTGEPS